MKKKSSADLDAVEAAIGYRFSDRSHLVRALTHTSAVQAPADSYQRLEFLGDRVLALTVADMLYRTFPDAEEGELARRLNAMVRRESCADIARTLGLGAMLRLGPGEAQSGGRDKNAILGDVAEAVIAAIHLDGGFAPARDFVERNWYPLMMEARGPMRDPKTSLQEWLQSRGLPAPTYRQVGRSGPDHDPVFEISVEIAGLPGEIGTGGSKRQAERDAATRVLAREGLWKDDGHV
jgi:ribonuclease-3